MTRFDDDMKYLQGAVSELEPYLLSHELYWPLGSGYTRGMVSSRLSLGALLLTIKRLESSTGQGEVSVLLEQVESASRQWRVHWQKKAAREFESRLNLWQNAFAELLDRPSQDQGLYSVEIRNRTMLDLLRVDAEGIPPHELTRLEGLDHRLKARLVPSGFIWEADLEPAFPRDKFWYLYGTLKS